MSHPSLTSRQITRVQFLEQSYYQMSAYQNQLNRSLQSAKSILNGLFQFEPQLKKSESSLTPKTSQELLQIVQINSELTSELIESIQKRNSIQGHVLIAQQIAEEYRRHEGEVIGDLEDVHNDLLYVLEKKQNRIDNLKGKIALMSKALKEKQNECNIVMSLSDSVLELHKEIQTIKDAFQHWDAKYNSVQLQKEEISTYLKELEGKVGILKHFTNVGAQKDGLNRSYNYEGADYSFSALESAQPPSKVTLHSEQKGLESVSNFDILHFNSRFSELKSLCLKRNNDIGELRSKISSIEEENQSLAKKLGKPILNTSIIELQVKKPHSNIGDYICQPPHTPTNPPDEPHDLSFELDNIEYQNMSDEQVSSIELSDNAIGNDSFLNGCLDDIN